MSEWRRLDGSPSPLGEIPVDDGEFSLEDAFAELEPDEIHFQEATGNAGASFERTYRRAALVIWPQDRTFAVLCQAGLAATLPFLEDMVQLGGGRCGPRRAVAPRCARACRTHDRTVAETGLAPAASRNTH